MTCESVEYWYQIGWVKTMAQLTLDLVNFNLPSQRHPYDRDPAHPLWFRRDKNTAQYENLMEWYGKEWADTLYQATGLPNDQRETGWKGVRPLGAGGFGWAALYELHQGGEVVDVSVDILLFKTQMLISGTAHCDKGSCNSNQGQYETFPS